MSLSKKICLRENEEITEIIRQTGAAYFWRYFSGAAILVCVSFFAFYLFSRGVLGCAVFGLGFLLGLSVIFRAWRRQRSNFWVITTERWVDIERPSFLEETVSSAFFDDIKDVFYNKKGIGARFFGYGSVIIETKSDKYALAARNVSRPEKLTDILIASAKISAK